MIEGLHVNVTFKPFEKIWPFSFFTIVFTRSLRKVSHCWTRAAREDTPFVISMPTAVRCDRGITPDQFPGGDFSDIADRRPMANRGFLREVSKVGSFEDGSPV